LSKHDLRALALMPGLLILVAIAALLIRLPLLGFISHDYVGFLSHWYDYITLNGMAHALGDRFANYTPAYLYLMTAAAYLREFVLTAMPKVVAIKLPSILADFLLALAMFKLVQVTSAHRYAPALAFALTLFLPTVVINSSAWGQADAIYSACVVACVWLLCARRPAAAMILFGLGAAFKAQAFFIAPLLAFLFFRRMVGIRHFAVAAGMYALVMLPAIMLGRPPIEALGTYLVQAGEYQTLSLGLPNLYAFAPADWYHFGLIAGLLLSAIAGLTLAIAFARQCPNPAPDDILACAMLSVAIMPFMLPKMHERYYFLADVMSIAVGLRWWKAAWLIPAYQGISLAGYATILDLPPLSSFKYTVNIRLFGVITAMVIAAATAQLAIFRVPSIEQRKKGAQVIAAGGALLLALGIAGVMIAPSQRRPAAAVGWGEGFTPPQAAQIRFGDAIELVGYALPEARTFRTGTMDITLFFKPLRPLSSTLQMRIEAFNTQGESLQLINQSSVDDNAPIETWRPGEIYRQTRFMLVWPTVDAPQAGVYKLSWVDGASGEALPATCDGAPCDAKLGLMPIGLDYPSAAPWLQAPALARFGSNGDIALLNVDAPASIIAGQPFSITTTWRQDTRHAEDLTLFLHVTGPDGEMVAQSDASMREGRYPTSLWHIGEVIPETREITLPATAPSGDYKIVAGFYRPDTLARVQAQGAGEAPSPDQTIVIHAFTTQP
jgi:Gpi18-like mannosyltransferase